MNVLVTGDSRSATALATELGELGLACKVAPPGADLAGDFVALERQMAQTQVVVCAGSQDPALAAAVVASKGGVPLAAALDGASETAEARIIGHLADHSGTAAQIAKWARSGSRGSAADLD